MIGPSVALATGLRPRSRHRRTRGVTLLELLVVLVVLGLLASVVGPSMRAMEQTADSPGDRVREARLRALTLGHTVLMAVELEGGRTVTILAKPDGTVWGADHLGLDPLSGL